MANKKINELSVRVPVITDLIGVGDPTTGYLYKSTLQQLQDLIEANIALTDLTDVTISAPSSGQVLRYDGTVWVNATETYVGTVTSVAMSVPTGLTIAGSPITTSGTLALTLTSGYSIPTNASQATWDTAYTNRITSLTTTGTSGASTLVSNVLNVPNYTLSGLGGQPQLNGTGFVKISGTTISYDNSTYLTTISGIAAGGDLSGTYANPTVLNSAVIGKVLTGYTSGAGTVAATDTILQAFQKLNGNIGALTTGVSSVFGRTGAVVATEGDYTLTQLSDVTITTPSSGQVLKYNGTAWVNNSDTDTGITTLNTLTALTQTFAVGTSGTDFAISSATSTHTFNLPTASATNRGALSSADWTTFNSKQGTITLTTTGTSGASTFSSNTLNVPNYGSALSGYLPLTGGTLTGPLSGTSASFVNGVNMATTSGNVGIGTTSPLSLLNVQAATNTNLLLTYTTNSGANFTQISGGSVNFPNKWATLQFKQDYNEDAHHMIFSTANSATNTTERMRITSGGNVGIGTTSPQSPYKVTISGTDTIFPAIYLENTTNTQAYSIRATGTNFVVRDNTSGNDRLTIASTGAATFSSNLTLSSSNGTLDVGGEGYIRGNGSAYKTHEFSTGASNVALYDQKNAAGTSINKLNAGGISYINGGNVLIGTTTDAGYKLDVNGTGRFVNGVNMATTSGNVGVGTLSAGVKLDVVGDAGVTWTGRFTNGNNIVYLAVDDANDWGIYVTGETKNYFSGNVGIGTVSPQYLLDVNGNCHVQTQMNVGTYDGGAVYPIQTGYALSLGEGATSSGKSLICDGAIAIGNTVSAAVAIASTHKVQISIGGTTYYLLSTNV